MVHSNQWLAQREGERFGVGDADQQCASEAWTIGDGDGVEVAEGDCGLSERGANNGNDVAQVFAGGELGDDPAKLGVGRDLRGDYIGQRLASVADNGRGGLVAGAFNPENQP